ncbi:MAG: hypothetical protein GX879_05655 [Bacteroidales bacterium]|nr:hypothetical protein [Bacteroidales bacterium]
MKTYKFKTNINCGGCLASIKPHLEAEQRIVTWEVDLNDNDKILTVQAQEISKEEIIEIVTKAGYRIEEQ